MLDCKIVNWMLKGPIEYNYILREFDEDLIKEVFTYEVKPIAKEVLRYYNRHKVTPNSSVLKEIFSDDDIALGLIDNVFSYSIEENEIGYLVEKLKDRYNRYLIKSMIKEYESDSENIVDFNSELKKIVGKTDRLYKCDVFSEGRLNDSVEDRISEYQFTKDNPEVRMGLMSGFKDLDDYTWGLKKSELMVIGGASSSGKSLLMMNMAINSWRGTNDPTSGEVTKNNGKNVLYISLEMSKKQLEQRIDANLADITHKSLMRGRLSQDEMDRWKKSLQFQKKYDKTFYILDMPRNSTMAEIEAKFEIIRGIFEPEAVFVDYLQLMSPSSGSIGSDWMDVGKVAEELHEFCRKKNLPVITAAQRKASMKKSSAKYKDNVDIEDLGRSKMIGDNATVVLLIGKREDEHLKEDMEVYVVKNRDGAKGKVMLKKSFEKSKIEDIPEGWVEDEGDENAV